MSKKLNSNLSLGAIFLGLSLFFTPNAKAASLYWDTVAGLGNGVGGTGNFTTNSATWSTVSTGSATLTAGTWTATGTMGLNDTAVFEGTAGTVTISSTSVNMKQVDVNVSGYTLANNSTGSNRYFNSTNGIVLGNGVNLNLSSAATAYNKGETGIVGGISNAAGATGTSVTVTGASGSALGQEVRIIFRTNGLANSGTIAVPMTIATTGASGAILRVADNDTTINFNGNITVNNGSKLTLSPGPSSSRVQIVNGNIITSAAGALVIGETNNQGLIDLRGNNTITGDLNVYGQLGYGSKTALGTSRVVLNQGSVLAQSRTIGDGSDAARNIANNILLNGTAWAANTYVTIGGLGSAQILDGGVDMGGLSRVLKIDNSTTFNGAISNSGGGGLVLTNSAGSAGGRTLTMAGAATYTGGTTLKSSGTGWKTTVSNTSGSAFGDGNVNFDGTGATTGTRSLLTGTGIITGTVGGNVQITAGSASNLQGGLLTVGKLDTATAMSFAFEATSTSLLSAGGYNNDVIRATATAGSPFTQALASGNIIDIYLNAGSLADYSNANAGVFQTGFFSASDFSLGSGTFNLFVQAAGGTTTYNAATYQTWAEYMTATGTALGQSYTIGTTSATLASGDTGFISAVTIVPEPSTGSLLAFGLGGLVLTRLLRRKQS